MTRNSETINIAFDPFSLVPTEACVFSVCETKKGGPSNSKIFLLTHFYINEINPDFLKMLTSRKKRITI